VCGYDNIAIHFKQTEQIMMYIVWVGGVIDYEGYNADAAYSIYNEWKDQGYDDVKLELVNIDNQK
jgi:hypothetical protein